MSSIHWLPWTADAFERARKESKPVLLSISAPWCHWCHEMDRTTYEDARIAAVINTQFVPVRVDADRRPDICERYMLGGLPTTSFLTADGDVIVGGNYVPADRMAGVLEQVSRAFVVRQDEIANQARRQTSAAETIANASEPELMAQVFATYDAEHGGFGTEPKFPITEPIVLALDVYRESDDVRMRTIAETTLDAMASGGLYDVVDGGFFRYATTRDWQLPHEEKLLDVNAALLRTYLWAAEALKEDRYLDHAMDILRYISAWLHDPGGGWWGSQHADHPYYSLHGETARRAAAAPLVDKTLYSGWNGAMVSAALHAARALDDSTWVHTAQNALERVLVGCYAPGHGVAHYFDGRPNVRGLLEDQISLIDATLDAYDVSGNITYEMMAEELGHYVLRTMWDRQHGGFFDRAPAVDEEAVGLLRNPIKPFGANCDAARVLRRLDLASGSHDFGAAADSALAFVRPRATAQGALAAQYLLAVREARSR